MLRLVFKNMFRKGTSKIYNFPVNTKFKFTLKKTEKGSSDPMEEFHRPGGHEPSATAVIWGSHRADGGCSVARWDFHRAGATGVTSHRAGLQGHRLGGTSTEPVGATRAG